MNRRITVRGIIVKKGKLFVQKQKKREGGEKDFWCTPGGGLEAGESLHEGLHREMIEETGVAPEIGKLLYMQQYAENGQEYLEFFFEITNVDDYETIDLSATSHGGIEIAHCEFLDALQENVLPAFLRNISVEQDIAHAGAPLIFSYLDSSLN